jgi:hypothetical protein
LERAANGLFLLTKGQKQAFSGRDCGTAIPLGETAARALVYGV